MKPADKARPDAKSVLLGLSAFAVGGVALTPAIVGLIIVGGIAWYGLRFLWQLMRILLN